MKEKGHILQLTPMGDIIKRAGASRVSASAKKALRDLLEDYALSIARKAIRLANHAGRLTVRGNDVSLAVKD